MVSETRPRRLLTAVAATTVTTLMLVACGGSEVTGATDAASGTAAQTEVAAPAPDAAPQAPAPEAGTAPSGADVAAPEAGAGAAPERGPAAAPEAGASAPQAPAPDAENADRPAKADKKSGKAQAAAPQSRAAPQETGLGAAVQKTVAEAAIFGGDAPCKPATLSEVNIGNVSTLSGVLGELFQPVRPALETFVASQNACGGLNGHKIKFFIDDDQGDPATAVTKVQNMIQNNKVLAFVGNIQVLTVDAIVPTMKQAGIPIIGADLTNNTWFTNPLFFPQGSSQQAVSYGYLVGSTEYHKKKNVGIVWCIEVPRSCEQINRAFLELAPQLGATVKRSIQVSITAPSYVQQCLDLKNAGVEALTLNLDAASSVRLARSCEQVDYFPDVVTYPVAVGNEKQFLGNDWLGNTYVPQNVFPWMATSTPAEKYWHASVKRFNPGFDTGGAASLGWTAGALLVAAASGLSEQNPTTQQFLEALYTFKGQEFTKLGGLTPAPLTYREGDTPQVPYCLFAAVTNDANTGWKQAVSKPTCTDLLAPSDPQNSG